MATEILTHIKVMPAPIGDINPAIFPWLNPQLIAKILSGSGEKIIKMHSRVKVRG